MRTYLPIFLLPALLVAGCDPAPTNPNPFRPETTGQLWPSRDTGDRDPAAFTVLLTVMSDPATHVRDAKRYEKALSDQLGWKDVFVVHKEGRSELYQGKFHTTAEAAKTLKAAKAYRAQNGLAVFTRAMVVPLPGRDVGPAEWKLTRAAGTHSVLVAVFRDVPEKNYLGRRRKAVEYCRRLRKQGVEGYYWHGDVSSHVTVGSFTESAFRRKASDGEIRIVATDPRLLKIQKDFPMLAINGLGENLITRDPRTGKIIRSPRTCHLIKIPRDENRDDRPQPDRLGLTQRR